MRQYIVYRAKGAKMSHIVIDEKKCKSCYLCADVCPKKLIQHSGPAGKSGQPTAKFEDKNNECLACAQCALVCPDLAITSIVKE